MKKYAEMTLEERKAEYARLSDEYKEYQYRALSLDMSRGKPCPQQLDLSMAMMDVLNSEADLICEDGDDCRNYGVLTGIHEAKELLSEIMENPVENLIVLGNSSLNTMFDCISRSYTHGVMGSTPWCKLPYSVKWLCVVPGYDRHFAITEYFGFQLISIPMLPTGPDMDLVEKYVNNDPAVKGIWCTPKYSNPTGNSYSDETVRRFARLEPAAPDFRIYWDNAYTVHHLYDDDQDYLLEILNECTKAGNPDMVYKFASTSKISFPGSGISAIAASLNNLEDIKKYMSYETIGHDKVNQLRHARFFENGQAIKDHMKKHAAILRPKFEMVENVFEEELGGLGIGTWTKPKGGYFISFDSLPGCAKKIVAKAKKAGVTLTPAGATWPYGIDPDDRNIRIAPSYPSLPEMELTARLFALCVKLVSLKKLITEES